MKGIRARRVVAVLCALGLSFTLTSNGAAGQEKASWRAKLPLGKWALSITPAPSAQPTVDLYSATTDARKGLGVTRVGLRNLSGSDVAAVKVGWRLFAAEQLAASLLTGETPLLGVALGPGEWRVVDYPVVTFAEAVRPLLKGNNLGGNYRIELVVTEVTYRDQAAKLVSGRGGSSSFVRVASAPDHATAARCRAKSRRASFQPERGAMFIKAAVWSAPAEACQDQQCMWGSGDCFMCNGAPNFGCRVDSCSSCTNSRCESQID